MITITCRYPYAESECSGINFALLGLADGLNEALHGIGGPSFYALDEYVGRHWFGKNIALYRVAPHFNNRSKIFGLLNTLRTNAAADTVGEIDHGLTERMFERVGTKLRSNFNSTQGNSSNRDSEE